MDIQFRLIFGLKRVGYCDNYLFTKILAKINKDDIVDNKAPSRTTASSDNCKPIAIRKTPKINTKNNCTILFMFS